MTCPDTVVAAALNQITRGDLTLPPTDDEVFGGIPTELPSEITQKIERPVGRDEDWEHENWENTFGDDPTRIPTGD